MKSGLTFISDSVKALKINIIFFLFLLTTVIEVFMQLKNKNTYYLKKLY